MHACATEAMPDGPPEIHYAARHDVEYPADETDETDEGRTGESGTVVYVNRCRWERSDRSVIRGG